MSYCVKIHEGDSLVAAMNGLIQEVSAAIKDGWKPQRGVSHSIVNNKGASRFTVFQAMVLDSKKS
jgi:hypothetical protein